jgi:hypothetical protein
MMRAAASMSLAFRSFILLSAISRSWVRVIVPALSRPGLVEPDLRPSASLIKWVTGGRLGDESEGLVLVDR